MRVVLFKHCTHDSKMFTNLFIISVMFLVLKIVSGETTKEPLKEIQQKSTLQDFVATSDTWDVNPNLNSLWLYRPSSFQSQKGDESGVHTASIRSPFSMTRLAKPLTFGFDPYFNKGYFEPFEKRQKPVTLVAFRRNGLLPRQNLKVEDSKSAEVAELQSPFNDISNIWQEEPGIINI